MYSICRPIKLFALFKHRFDKTFFPLKKITPYYYHKNLTDHGIVVHVHAADQTKRKAGSESWMRFCTTPRGLGLPSSVK